nr:hypothetical protein [Tanacetum cinerariifolium]
MASTNPKTKHKPEKTKAGEAVLDLVIPYIHNVEDQNSVSLLSRKFYEIDGITRKCLTVHVHYYPNPASLSKRFPYIESLTLKGPPTGYYDRDDCGIRITPWIEQLALEFRCLKELRIHCLVHDEDLETLARTRGKDLSSLKINGIWLHQLALNGTVLERLHVTNTDIISNAEDLKLLAKNCCNSLISLKVGACYLCRLGDAFRYAVRLEHFGGHIWDEERDIVGFRLPPYMQSLSVEYVQVIRYSIILPFSNQIRKLKVLELDTACHCLLFKRCPNLEVLYTVDDCGDRGLKVIGKFCKKLRKLTHNGLVTHVGLIALVTNHINAD